MSLSWEEGASWCAGLVMVGGVRMWDVFSTGTVPLSFTREGREELGSSCFFLVSHELLHGTFALCTSV